MMQLKRNKALHQRRNVMGRKIKGHLDFFQVRALEDAGLTREEILDWMDRGYLLPMAGGTTAQNQQAESPIYVPIAMVVSTDQTVNQNDMVWWDPVNYTLKPLTTVAQVAVSLTGGYVGVAAGSANPNVYPAPQAGTPSENLPGVVVQRGGSAFLNSTVGDGAYSHFQPVTVGADAQTVTRGGETTANRVGLVLVRPAVNARGTPGATPVSETDGSTRVRVWIEPKFPDTALL